MTLEHFIFGAMMLAVGVPSALRLENRKLRWRNPTAAALVLCWIVAEGLALAGKPLAVSYYLFPDIFVVAIIFTKALVGWRSHADRIVLLIYPLVWWTYAAAIDDYYKWWLLWPLAIVQILAVGMESHPLLHRAHDSDTPAPAPGDGFYRLAWGKAGDG